MPVADVGQQASARAETRWAALLSMDSGRASRLVVLITFMLACAAIALHVPGQVSMDTSIQLYEASIGQSLSWNPPFMSALLRWLGGGEMGTSMIVLINAVLLYGAFAVVAMTLLQVRASQGVSRIATWRVVLALLLIFNPIVFIYVGIVWKDVLFASFLTAACACAAAASIGSLSRRTVCVALSILLLAAGYHTRQHGMFMAPLLLLVPILASWSFMRSKKVQSALVVFVLFVMAVAGFQQQVNSSIKGADDRASSVGFRGIMQYDIAGIISDSKRPYSEFATPINAEQYAAVQSAYNPGRIDYLSANPVVGEWMAGMPGAALSHAWWEMIKQNPTAYVQHKVTAYATLLGLRGIEGTLPVHVGVEGNKAYLESVGIKTGTNSRSQKVFDLAAQFFNWPIYYHAFWLFALVALAVIGARVTLPKPFKAMGGVIALATLVFYGAFLPTTLASDFRYLFGAIPLIMVLGLMLLLGTGKQKAVSG